MLNTEQLPQNDRLARFPAGEHQHFHRPHEYSGTVLRAHLDRMHYKEWVRFCLATSLVPDILAAACAVFDFDDDVINERMPALLERALTAVPTNTAFISDAMSGLPDHRRMRIVVENLHGGRGEWTWAREVQHAFDDALCQTLAIAEPAEQSVRVW